MERKRYFQVLQVTGLTDLFAEFVRRNRSNDVPYHNLWHTQQMIELCYEGAVGERLSERESAAVVCAAVWHDFDHTAAPGPDERNIERAIAGFDKADIPAHVDRELAAACIRATLYPHRDMPDGLPHAAAVIRDADMMMSFAPTLHTHVVRGLSAELNVTPGEAASRMVPFIESIHWHTDWGRSRAAALIPAAITESRFLAELYGRFSANEVI